MKSEKMQKELALAFSFGEAPTEVKDAAKSHRENFLRLAKAESQFARWKSELEQARRAHDVSADAFSKVLNAWDPAKIKGGGLEEKTEGTDAKP